MEGERFQWPVIRYELINVDNYEILDHAKEYRRTVKACNKAFHQFEQLRGEILSQAIAVERELDRLISWYFVPRLNPEKDEIQEEEDHRRDALVDLVLGQEGFSFSFKRQAAKSIMVAAEISKPKPKELENSLISVMEIRNQVAHRKVGVDYQTQDIALWDAKKRRWGFPVFDSEGNKAEKKWHKRIPGNLGDNYSKYCQLAISVVYEARREIGKLRETNSMCDDQ